jgi:glycosyltransferase involved in cell wall biosynthesis
VGVGEVNHTAEPHGQRCRLRHNEGVSKVICIHPRFAGLTSHHFNESSALLHEFDRRGTEFLLLINIHADSQTVDRLHARAVLDDPTFRLEWTFEERSRRFLEMLHAQVDNDVNANDCVLITVSTQLEAHALTQWLQDLPRDRKPWIVILIISDRWNRYGREEYDRQIAEFHKLNAAISSLAPGDANRLIFFTLTDLLAQELEGLLGTKVDIVPMPIEYGDRGLYASPKRHWHLRRVALLGGTRREKGSHLVPDIVRACRPHVRVEFLVHLTNNNLTAEEAGKLAHLDRERHVTVIREPMSLPEYNRALNSADVALFPYEIIPYRKRTSGVFAEAVAYGKPVVVPRGTWMEEQIAAGRAAGTIFEDLRPDSIARALACCLENLKLLQKSAQTMSVEWRKNYDIRVFVDLMEEQIALRSPAPAESTGFMEQ